MQTLHPITTFAIVILTIVGCASEHQDSSPSATPLEPLISLDSQTHILGTIPEGGIEETFRFRNQLKQCIRVAPALTSCACNRIVYSADVVQPGETLVVTAHFNGKAQAGMTRSHFQVPWVAKDSSGNIDCIIEATVETALKLTPDRTIIAPVDGALATVTIEQRHGQSRPTSVWSSRSEISGSLSQVDDTHWEVVLRWQNEAPDETRLPPLANDGGVIIIFAEGAGHQQYRIPVQVRHRRELALSSNQQE